MTNFLARRIHQSPVMQELARLIPEQLKDRVRPMVIELLEIMRRSDYRAAVRGSLTNSDTILNRLRETYQPVECPLILISQVQRCGGSLMSQLFDGHSQLLAHPQEMKIGYPEKDIWPPIDHRFSANKQFKMLFESPTIEMSRFGYAKGKKDRNRKNFFFLPKIQREIFQTATERIEAPAGSRDILNAYFTAYFNSWLNLRAEISRAKFVTGFTPMLASKEANMEKFWDAYPDGYLISILRSPFGWYPFAQLLDKFSKLGGIEKAARWWCESTQAMIREKRSRPDRVIVLRFDELLANTEATMRHVCDRIGIAYEAALLSPSFNGEPIGANTSFETLQRGQVSSAPLDRGKLLEDSERAYLEKHCLGLYEQALDKVVVTVLKPAS